MSGIFRSIVAMLIAVSLCGLRSTAQAIAADTANGDLAQARTSLHAGDLARAEAQTRAFIAAHPDSAEAMYLLGRILEDRKQATESLAWFTKAAAIATPSGEDLRVVAMDYVLLNAYPQAIHWLTSSVAQDPGNAEAWYDLGRARMMQGDYAAAKAPLLRALTLQPGMAKAENNLGVIYEEQNESGAAAKAYQQAIEWQRAEAHPSEQPFLKLGALLLEQGQTAEALRLLRRAIEIKPDNVRCNQQLARALEQQGDLSGAIAHMQQAIAQQPRSASLHYQLGQMYRRNSQPENAKHELDLSQQLYGAHEETDPQSDNR